MQGTETVLSSFGTTRKRSLESPLLGNPARRVREGADGKGPALRAPRRRPTSLEVAGAGNGVDDYRASFPPYSRAVANRYEPITVVLKSEGRWCDSGISVGLPG